MSFDEESREQVAAWVLDHGLARLPLSLDYGQTVAIARFGAPMFAAVLFVEWDWGVTEPSPVSEVLLLERFDNSWRALNGTGGGAWFSPPLVRPVLDPHEVRRLGLHYQYEAERFVAALYGVAGSAADIVEVRTGQSVRRWPVESPLGAWIAAFPADGESTTVNVLDKHGGIVFAERIERGTPQ